MKKNVEPLLIFLVLLALFTMSAQNAGAQADYPSKLIKFIVPTPPGGPTDTSARLIVDKMSKALGQPVVIENKPGGGNNIGADFVAKSAPDGYTILMANFASNAVNETLYKKLPFNPSKDFAAVSQVYMAPLLFVVHPSVPAKNVQEFIAYAKANPGKLNRASSGNGTSMHLASEMFRIRTGLDLPHIPYKGSGPALTDLISGHVQLLFDSIVTALPHVKSGKLRALGVTGTKRSPVVPDVPTIAEQGLPGFSAYSWVGVAVPAKTPPAIVAKLNRAIVSALKDPETVAQFAALGGEAVPSTPEEFDAFMKAETIRWGKVVRECGIQVE